MVQNWRTDREAKDKDLLSTSQRLAIINLIEKIKDKKIIQNWRAISLLTVDLKNDIESSFRETKKMMTVLQDNYHLMLWKPLKQKN